MLFAECDGSVSLICNNGSIAAKLMHAETYRSCNCLTERMLRCICVIGEPPRKSATPDLDSRATKVPCRRMTLHELADLVLTGQDMLRPCCLHKG